MRSISTIRTAVRMVVVATLQLAGVAIPTSPAHAVNLVEGSFTGTSYGSCFQPAASLICDFEFNTTFCTEDADGVTVGDCFVTTGNSN